MKVIFLEDNRWCVEPSPGQRFVDKSLAGRNHPMSLLESNSQFMIHKFIIKSMVSQRFLIYFSISKIILVGCLSETVAGVCSVGENLLDLLVGQISTSRHKSAGTCFEVFKYTKGSIQ